MVVCAVVVFVVVAFVVVVLVVDSVEMVVVLAELL